MDADGLMADLSCGFFLLYKSITKEFKNGVKPQT